MSTYTILVDVLAAALALTGFLMAFRQRLVRRWWRRAFPRDPALPPRPQRSGDEDPVHYALIIFGIMVMAFGLILFSFTTAFALMTA
jgi:uncharacterized iron-regulated membrane protein